MSYRLAVFDFDGTLSDSFSWLMGIFNEVADRYGFRRVADGELELLRTMEARKIVGHLGMPTWKMPLVARHMRRRMAGAGDGIALFPGADAMLRTLAERGVTIAIVTSNSAENVRRVLGPENAALVRHWGCEASVFGKRPKLRRVLRESGISPAETISIGDEIRDLHAARAEKVAFGAVSWGYTTSESLRAHGADRVFTRMEEITEALAPAGAS